MEIKVRNWDKWQTYRKDRGAPPWIKLHRNLMSNKDWAKLSDAEKGQLCSMWIVAADKDGKLPSCPIIIRKICQLDAEPNISKFAELGFFDANVTPPRRQRDANVTPNGCHGDTPEKIREEKKREEKKETKTSAPDGVTEKTWIDFLSLRKKKNAPVTDTVIAGLKREGDKAGITLDEVMQECCVQGWRGFKAEWYKKPAHQQKTTPVPDNYPYKPFSQVDPRLPR